MSLPIDLPRFCESRNDEIILRLRATPNARTEGFDGIHTDSAGIDWLRVRVRAVPEGGKANKAVIALLAKSLGLAKAEISIVAGHTARNKTLCLAGRVAGQLTSLMQDQ